MYIIIFDFLDCRMVSCRLMMKKLRSFSNILLFIVCYLHAMQAISSVFSSNRHGVLAFEFRIVLDKDTSYLMSPSMSLFLNWKTYI